MTAVVSQLPIRRASENHPHFPQPADREARVWRYLNVPHIMQLLRNRTLWMSRSDKLGDPCEGSRPKGDARIYEAAQRAILADGHASYFEAVRGSWKHMDDSLKTRMFISCWQMSEYEDISMWQRYCKPKEAGVAIQTTYKRLDSAVPLTIFNDRQIMLGLVSYGDYDAPDFTSNPANAYSTYMLKKIQYRNEHEVRLICDMFRCEASGIAAPIDVEMLIESVVFSPYAKAALVQGVERAIRNMGYRFPISHSTAFDVAQVY